MKKVILTLAASTLMCTMLASCGKTDATPARAKTLASYVNSSIVSPGSYGEGSWTALTYQVNLFENNVYEYITTQLIYGYGMSLGTTSIINYGTYAKGATEDGITTYTLNIASEVVFNSYSLAGGYNISINTENATYPVEMLAKTQGEKNMASSKEDVVKEYGAKRTYYSSDSKNNMSLKNPNE